MISNQSEEWSELKKVRVQIATYSIKKAMMRVFKQTEEEKIDNLDAQQKFNHALAKEINFQKVATEYGDANSVTRGVFSAKGDLYVTVGSSGQGKVWNTQNPKEANFCSEISSLKSNAKICSVDFHPRVGSIPGSAPNILTGSTTGELSVWSLLKELQEQKCIVKQAHSERINSINYMETGSYFLSSSYDKSWALWDGKRINKILSQRGHQKQIHTSSLHPDQSLYLTGDLGGYGMVWDLRTGKGIYQIKQSDSILCARFHPNGFEFAVAGKANLITIFDLRRKKQLKRIPAHLKLISDLKYDQNGMFLASVSHDNSIRLWHGQNYSPLPIDDLTEQHKITSLDIREGKLAVTCIDRKWSMLVNSSRWKSDDLSISLCHNENKRKKQKKTYQLVNNGKIIRSIRNPYIYSANICLMNLTNEQMCLGQTRKSIQQNKQGKFGYDGHEKIVKSGTNNSEK